jgi:hypothetical protein
LFKGGSAAKSKLSRPFQALHRREAGLTDAPLDQPPLTVDQLELAQAQQIARVVDALGGAPAGQLVVFPEERR